jgi:hypothetical protein
MTFMLAGMVIAKEGASSPMNRIARSLVALLSLAGASASFAADAPFGSPRDPASVPGIPGNGRISRLPVNMLVFTGVTRIWINRGALDIGWDTPFFDGRGREVTKPAGFPDWAYDKTVIALSDWELLARLGPDALANFELFGPEIALDGETYRQVRAAEPAVDFYTGQPVNLSARAVAGPGEAAATAGFVVSDGPAMVLVRAVGSTLRQFGVAGVLEDPYLTIQKGTNILAYNDNWESRHDAATIVEVSRKVGAFPLPAGSKDAAYLMELTPGAYTARVESLDRTSGIVLLEVYIIPGKFLPTVIAGQ